MIWGKKSESFFLPLELFSHETKQIPWYNYVIIGCFFSWSCFLINYETNINKYHPHLPFPYIFVTRGRALPDITGSLVPNCLIYFKKAFKEEKYPCIYSHSPCNHALQYMSHHSYITYYENCSALPWRHDSAIATSVIIEALILLSMSFIQTRCGDSYDALPASLDSPFLQVESFFFLTANICKPVVSESWCHTCSI